MAKKKIEENKAIEEEKVKNVEIVEEDYGSDYEEEELTVEERIINIEKKVKASFWLNIITTVLIAFLLILLLGGGNASSSSTGSTGESSQETSGYDTSAFNQIYPEDIASLSKGKTIVVWIGYQSCGFCQAYAPLLAQVTKEYGITANYIDLSTVTNAQVQTIVSLEGKGDWKDFAASFEGTPFTLFIKDNKVVGGINGYREANEIAKAFDNAGIKKK